MKKAAIGGVIEQVSKWDPRKDGAGVFTYVDLSSVDRKTKAVAEPSRVNPVDAPSRARQLINAGDVLVSTVRPNLNAVAFVQPELDGATASTGFCVLRPREGALDGRYLFQWVRSPFFVEEMVSLATGASYPAVSDKIVKASSIPLPAIEKQRRIAALLDAADALRAKRRQAIAKLDTLTQAIFSDMFGDPARNTMGWPVRAVGDLVERFETGKSVAAGPDNVAGGFRVLKVSAVTSRRYRARESKPVPLAYIPPPSHFVGEGDLLFSRANTTELVGACAYVHQTPPNHLLSDKLWRFVWNEPRLVEPLYIWRVLQNRKVRKEIGDIATGSSGSMKNISQAKFRRLELPVPPLEIQARFVQRFSEIEEIRVKAADPSLLDALFASLQQRAFRGEL
jgi:type I restriction enzyme, S subunit